MATIRGGKQHHRDIAQTTIDWAISRLGLSDHTFEIIMTIQPLDESYGECLPGREAHRPRYNVSINPEQSLRNFIGTIVHEMIHVRQYLEGEWTGDGERECRELEMLLTDELWKEGLI